jgi:glycosyltransferase involved in cell wall biosynthesis
MSGRLAGHGWDPVKNWRETRRIRSCYVRLDGLTAVSRAVAHDLTHHFGITRVPIAVLNNPILPDDLDALAAAHCRHPWLQEPRGAERPPVILALGGLRQVKDFATLLRAFALLPRPDARLLIIGEGKEREKLAALARRLGIAGRVDLHGFVDNPFPYLARSDLVVLSSRREGLPNVLVESMALGTPVVATDCSGGVRELLQDGRLGALAPVGDPQALNQAIMRAIDEVRMGALDPDPLRAATGPYHLLPAARAYLKFFAKLHRADASSPASNHTAL